MAACPQLADKAVVGLAWAGEDYEDVEGRVVAVGVGVGGGVEIMVEGRGGRSVGVEGRGSCWSECRWAWLVLGVQVVGGSSRPDRIARGSAGFRNPPLCWGSGWGGRGEGGIRVRVCESAPRVRVFVGRAAGSGSGASHSLARGGSEPCRGSRAVCHVGERWGAESSSFSYARWSKDLPHSFEWLGR